MNEELISRTIIASVALLSSIAGLTIMYNKLQDRRMAEAKEKAAVAATEARERSAGATAIEEIKADLKKNSAQIAEIREDIEEMRTESRSMAKEYLDTLKQLAGRFKN